MLIKQQKTCCKRENTTDQGYIMKHLQMSVETCAQDSDNIKKYKYKIFHHANKIDKQTESIIEHLINVPVEYRIK